MFASFIMIGYKQETKKQLVGVPNVHGFYAISSRIADSSPEIGKQINIMEGVLAQFFSLLFR